MAIKLYGYFRSSAAFRVRIALNLKKLEYETAPIHLRRNDQTKSDYLAVNPQGLVPTLVDGSRTLFQSLAIVEYLDESSILSRPYCLRTRPDRARIRALAEIVACDIHPINNLRVLRYLTHSLGHDEAAIATWSNHWIAAGFEALEKLLAEDRWTGGFCYGDTQFLPKSRSCSQVVNAERYRLDLTPYATITRIFRRCMELEPFLAAHPDNQPDREA